MKLIEAMKKLKTIQKRVDKNCERITEYASYVSSEPLAFETESAQRQEVNSLIQANIDLETEYLRLKEAIEETNLKTKVKIGNFEYSISSLISMMRVTGPIRRRTYASLTPKAGMDTLQTKYPNGIDIQNPPRVIRLYDEKMKNDLSDEWQEFLDSINSKLEVVNAETELLNY